MTSTSRRRGQQRDLRQGSDDHDIGLIDGGIFEAAVLIGVQVRAGGTRTTRLTNDEIDGLGLRQTTENLRSSSEREVAFMIFVDQQASDTRGQSMPVGGR
jgi:hypothetical protein